MAVFKFLDMRDIERGGVLHGYWTEYRAFDPTLTKEARYWEYPAALHNALEYDQYDVPISAIDVGAGHSLVPYFLAEKCGWNVSILEPPSMPKHHLCVERVNARKTVTLIQADGRVPGSIAKAAYNCVLCISVLEHVDVSKNEHLSMLANLCDAVRPGGRLVLTVDAADKATRRQSSANGHNFVFGLSDLRIMIDLCADNGLYPSVEPNFEFDWSKKRSVPPTKYDLVPFAMAFDKEGE